jgi:hypothetical protein
MDCGAVMKRSSRQQGVQKPGPETISAQEMQRCGKIWLMALSLHIFIKDAAVIDGA